MHEFSAVDGFVEITESLAEMIKCIANEPSLGLYYIQQHTQNSVPNVINLNNSILENSRQTILHTEDLKDSIAMVSSMKDCGSPIANEMIGDIKNCLSIISTKQPKTGLILNNSFWGPATSVSSFNIARNSESNGYFSSVFKSAKERASNLKWPQLEFKEHKLESDVDERTHHLTLPLTVASASTNPSMLDAKTGEPPVSSDIVDEVQEYMSVSHQKLSLVSANYKAEKEAKLKACMEYTDGNLDNNNISEIDAEGS